METGRLGGERGWWLTGRKNKKSSSSGGARSQGSAACSSGEGREGKVMFLCHVVPPVIAPRGLSRVQSHQVGVLNECVLGKQQAGGKKRKKSRPHAYVRSLAPQRGADNETDLSKKRGTDAGAGGYLKSLFLGGVFPVQNKSKTVIHNMLQLALWATDHL